MTKLSSIFSTQLSGHLNNLEYTRKKMEVLFSKKQIVERDLNVVYAGLFLGAVTSFETLLEDLFLDLLTGRTKHISSKVRNKVTFSSTTVCRSIIYGGKKYVDWLPYNYTTGRAEIFFKEGLPFSAIEKADNNTLQEIMYIRNVLAHNSKHALKVFENMVIGSRTLLPKERTPVGYLRRPIAASPPQTQYEVYVAELAKIAYILCVKGIPDHASRPSVAP